jgi:hypothetical protein
MGFPCILDSGGNSGAQQTHAIVTEVEKADPIARRSFLFGLVVVSFSGSGAAISVKTKISYSRILEAGENEIEGHLCAGGCR